MKKGEKTKELLLECAEKAFSQKGYYETQVSDIVNIAHVAKGTIYLYFKNKEDVFLSLILKYADLWEKAVELDMKDYMGDKPGIYYGREYVKHRIYRTVEYFGENQDRSAIILRLGPGLNKTIESIVFQFENKILNVLKHDIELGKKQGHIPDSIETDLIGNALVGATLRMCYYYFILKNNSFSDLKVKGLMDKIVNMVLSVLKMGEI